MALTKTLTKLLARHAPGVHNLANIVARGRFEVWPPRVTYALGELHEKINARFDRDGGSFFEVGANNGLTQSNTAYLEFYRRWRGILVEAVPHKFVECVRNRPNADVVHAALVDHDYAGGSMEVIYSDLMSMTAATDMDRAAHLAAGAMHMKDGRLQGQRFLAPARTVMSVVDELRRAPVDLFSLDVEGSEASVLGGIDFARWRPAHFLIESDEPERMHALMAGYGYYVAEQFSFHDYLYRDRG